ncbi:thrombospondin type-1 domain-containing protein 4-like [Ailuropoda melanoleuca]|uniref:thrombospondin type-1 domain-containing protein 4-like n=1 Tax=Ailuropoda melanoleuca TaxID=9646 RepID=UPI0014946069|nr:thrombospondin type-1 domain-containing protein 4-like [Ailuropoda melanoleuca]
MNVTKLHNVTRNEALDGGQPVHLHDPFVLHPVRLTVLILVLAPCEETDASKDGVTYAKLHKSRTRGPIGPGKYGYGKAPYILPLQTDSAHSPQRLRRQRPSSGHSRSQAPSGPNHGYSPPAHRAPQHGPLYQSDSGPRSGLQTSEASVYQLPLTHDQGFPAASSLFHSPETSSNHGMGAPRAAQSFLQPAQSAAISCIGAYRQYKLCNTNVCPESSRSIREVQCASYNNKPFMGRFYEWEPFAEVKGNRKCELNCQAMGYRFYVRQAEKVIDGTPCDQNGTAICVSGQCKMLRHFRSPGRSRHSLLLGLWQWFGNGPPCIVLAAP